MVGKTGFRKITANVSRLLLAVTFIFSGFVKAVDPLGTQYKIHDYLVAMSIEQFVPDYVTLAGSVLLSAFEFTLGIMLLFAAHRHIVSRLTLLMMSIMTIVTIWIAVSDPVSDCGCFGDAIHLTNFETLLKNIVLLAAAAAVTRWPTYMPRFVSRTNQWIVGNYTVLFILIISGYCLYHLPLFDFRPYHIGANIPQGMEIPKGAQQPKFDTRIVMSKNGELKEITLDEYAKVANDTSWKYVDTKTVQTEKGFVPPIHDFSITDISGADITANVLGNKGYTLLLVSPHLEFADDSNIDRINQMYDYAHDNGYAFYCLTASDRNAVSRWQDISGAEYPFCTTDETTLKTIIRSNPGMVLIKNGTVINKWSHNDLPDEYALNGKLEQLSIGKMNPDSVPHKIAVIILCFVLPLLLLTFADRTWAWTRWIRKKNKVINNLNNYSNMRKKIVAGNWKMNMNLQNGIALAKELNDTLKADKPNCGVIICTPFIHLASIAEFLDQNIIGLGAENCADKEKGAFTGEVSAEMVKSTGAQYVILGHSERRGYYHDTPEILKEKVQLALANGLKVIFCIGESLEEREANKQNEIVKAELEGSVFNLSEEDFRKIIIAYEPIWAIGTGKTATAEQAEEIHAYIRSVIAGKYGKQVAEDTTILYGGSCKASNAPELFAKPDIDGGLIGGASLKAPDFKGIIDAWKK
jgi:triosephosphate isomerase